MRRNFRIKYRNSKQSKASQTKETFPNEMICWQSFLSPLTTARVKLQCNQNLNTICTQSMTDCARDSIE